MDILQEGFLYLLAAVVAVPIASKLGLGSVLGYLIAGVFIGPVFGLLGENNEDVQHFAEFGVVMMLFLIGLELKPSILWKMRSKLLGLGLSQVLITSVLFAGIFYFVLGYGSSMSIAIGMILALSSTAIVLKTLQEKNWIKRPGGEASFSVLLVQDIAVIPMIALFPLLAAKAVHSIDNHHAAGGISHLSTPLQVIVILLSIASIVVAGRYFIRPIFRFIAESKLSEIFTATALLLVVGITILMNFVGLSPALGAFLAGVVLSGNEYRHELESDIDPFKGLLLGLFFISVGAGMDLSLLAKDPVFILSLALLIMLTKAMVLFGIAKATKIQRPENWLFILGLSQAGEFAFVLFSLSKGLALIEPGLLERLSLVVAVTMFLTPLLFLFYEKVILPRSFTTVEPPEYDKIDKKGRVVIAGSGRFGQIVSRLLTSYGFEIVTLEHDPKMIELLRRFESKAYYGDATRPDLLRASGLAEADVFIAATNDRHKQILMIEHVSKNYPNVRILARARDRHHVYELEAAGAHFVVRETFESSLELSKQAMIALGIHPFMAEIKKRKFKNYDLESLSLLKNRWLSQGVDDDYTEMAKARGANLTQLMQNDMASYNQIEDDAEEGWVPPPPDISVDN